VTLADVCSDFCGSVVDDSEPFDKAAKELLRQVEWYSGDFWGYDPRVIKALRDAINRMLAEPDVNWNKMQLLTLAWQVCVLYDSDGRMTPEFHLVAKLSAALKASIAEYYAANLGDPEDVPGESAAATT
jgi:hypothetical protein